MQNFDSGRPIYLQIIDGIKVQIVAGDYPAGFRLASVRDLATQAGVNPNTMQRALSELEREGLLFTQRTNGRFVTEDQSMINQLRQQLAREQISQLLQTMKHMGFTQEEIFALISDLIKEMN